MTGYIARRLLQGVLVLALVTVFIFLVMRLLPGDPLVLYLTQGELNNYNAANLAALRHQYGLDKSLPMQYIDWIGSVLHGKMGISIFHKVNVGTLIAGSLPITMHLGILSIIISTILGITMGVACALRRGKWIDTLFTFLANIGITAPSFWVGILLIYFLALKLSWLPVYGYTSPFTDFSLSTRQIIMPVFCLSLFPIASITRQTRSSTLEVVRQDYIRTAWSKGLKERTIVIRHIIKNALVPVVTILGLQVGNVFGGAVLIETVFNISGMGRLLSDAVFTHDYQIVQSAVLIISTVVVLSNIIIDILYGWFDPRIKYE